MVRGSSHVFRISCLHYGAKVVFSPGLVDRALIDATRRDEGDHTVIFTSSNGHDAPILRTCPEERDRLVLQIISDDSAMVVTAIKKLEDIISGIDLNCGCPEHFAVHRGCGSSMQIETAVDIVKVLTRETERPVSVKFRIDPDITKSIQFAQAVAGAGASAITVHGRVKAQKHRGTVNVSAMRLIFESVAVFKIGNGGVTSLIEAEKMRRDAGCDSVMICTAAMKSPAVFSTSAVTEMEALAAMAGSGKRHSIPFTECKWSMQQVASSTREMSKTVGQAWGPCKTWEDVDRLLAAQC